MSSSVLIRQLAVEDAEALKPFRLRALEDGEDAFHSSPAEWERPIEDFRRMIKDEVVFAAFDEAGAMCGLTVLALTPRSRIKLRHKAEVWSVYVASAARRQGLARRLVETCIREARDRGFEALVLTATARNAHVVAFYRSLGFRIYGTEPGMLKLPDGTRLDEHYMQLDLV